MNTESQFGKLNKITKENEQEFQRAPDKKSRLKQIFAKIKDAKPVSTAKSATMLVTSAFKEIEGMYDTLSEEEKMTAYPIIECSTMQFQDHLIYYRIYDHHIIFYGENGSIDIRQFTEENPPNDKLLGEEPSYPKDNMQITFEKPGADGKKVWD